MARQTYADLLKEEAQRRLTQQTERTRSSIAPQRQVTENILGQSRQQALGNVQNILTQAGGQYGVAPSAVQAGTSEFAGRETRGLERQSAETLDRSRLTQMRTYFNQVYNVALAQYQQAGYSLEQSNEFARQYALDETDRAFGSEQAQKGREFELEKEGIREDISKRGAEFEEGLDTGNPYMQAFIQSLSGLAGAATTYGIVKSGKGGKTKPYSPYPQNMTTFQDAQPSYNVNRNYPKSQFITPREQSVYDLHKPINDIRRRF